MATGKSAAASAKVLVVEDEVLLLTSLSNALQEAGFATVEATNADDAIEMLAGEPIRLVVTDLRMPGRLDGADLVKWLTKTRPSLPVVVTTGYHVDRATLGNVPIFEKPYRLAALIEHVSLVLQGR
jgi:DNA-binding NtrC family response regulator